ncbi:MAG: efflux RND transporter periplasmic adaptor subunit [Rhodobacteraceae bacterium]|nr:efflux RND transporter periplasmic adaptor subunit [Paracoccaceae bacterium]
MKIVRYMALALLAAFSPAGAKAQSLPFAKVQEVQSSGGNEERRFFGNVVARQTNDLAFQVGGQIIEFPAIEGATIPQGGLIARLDREPFVLALDRARIQAAQARRTLTRLEKLSGTAVSQVTVDDARTQLELADLSVAAAERDLEQATLVAPFDALVATRHVANFSTISPGTSVARLHDMSELRIEIDVPEILFSRAGEDPNVQLLAKFPASETLFDVALREFNAETSAIGQTYSITLGMEPPAGLVVLPGASVAILVRFLDQAARIIIPYSALVTTADGTSQVMVFTPVGADQGRVAVRPIEIMPTSHGEVMVTKGLEVGEEIIAAGAALLADGDEVRRFVGFPN